MSRMWLFLVFAIAFVQSRQIRARYPSQKQYGFSPPYENQPENEIAEMDQRKFLPSRRLNLWGSKTSKIIRGSAFIPGTMSDYTGKLATHRRQLWQWKPDREFLNQYLRYN